MESRKDVSEMMIVVRNNIHAERLIKNYTQAYMAYKLSISQNAYSKVELGFTLLTVKRIFEIAAILDINVSKLIGTSIENKDN